MSSRAPGRPSWGGRSALAWTQAVLARYGTTCQLRLDGCTGVATTGDHVVPKSVDPSRQYDVTNGRPACRPCNSKRGDGRRDHELGLVRQVDNRVFFASSTSGDANDPQTSPTTETVDPTDVGRPVVVVVNDDSVITQWPMGEAQWPNTRRNA